MLGARKLFSFDQLCKSVKKKNDLTFQILLVFRSALVYGNGVHAQYPKTHLGFSLTSYIITPSWIQTTDSSWDGSVGSVAAAGFQGWWHIQVEVSQVATGLLRVILHSPHSPSCCWWPYLVGPRALVFYRRLRPFLAMPSQTSCSPARWKEQFCSLCVWHPWFKAFQSHTASTSTSAYELNNNWDWQIWFGRIIV